MLNIEGDNGSFIRIEQNSYFSFSISDGTQTSKSSLRSNALFNNEWHQIICTRDRDDKKICIFIDGEQKTEIDDECGDLSISKISIGNRDEESGSLALAA